MSEVLISCQGALGGNHVARVREALLSHILTKAFSVTTCSSVSSNDASYLFQNFKVLNSTKAYKAFQASGSNDAVAVGDRRLFFNSLSSDFY